MDIWRVDHMEDLKNIISDPDREYFEKRPMLWNFGEKFVEYVFDDTITSFLKQLDGTGHPQGVKIMKNMTGDLSPQQIERLKKLMQCTVFNSLSAMLDFLKPSRNSRSWQQMSRDGKLIFWRSATA